MSRPLLTNISRHIRNPYDKAAVRHLDRPGSGLDYRDEPGAESKDR